MLTRSLDLLAALRARPLRERQILAAASYLAIALIVAAVWVSTLPDLLAPLASPPEPTGAPPSPPASLPAGSRPAEPPSPFQSIRQAAGEFSASIKEFTAELERLGRGAEAPSAAPAKPGIAAAARPPAEAAMPAPSTAAPPPPTGTSPGIATILRNAAKGPPLPGTVPTLPPGQEPLAAGALGRLHRILAVNLAIIRQAAADFSRYLTE